jgi:hypothetical protein
LAAAVDRGRETHALQRREREYLPVFLGGGGQGNAPDGIAAGEFSIVFVPDTQYYSESYPATFLAQTQWIADHAAAYNIQAVLHEGDVVDENLTFQWVNGDAAWDIIDAANIPYLVAIGNHDYDAESAQVGLDRAATSFNAYFPQSRYTAHGWWNGGFYEAGHTENSYLLLTIGGTDYILLNLEFGPRDAVLTWANGLLTTYAARKAIIVTHSYMYIDGTRVGTGDQHNPKIYAGGNLVANDGEEMWTELVKLHDNILWVQNGHHIFGNAARRSDLSDGGTAVTQVFANWQEVGAGGDGWMRLLTFGGGRIRVQTFSPTLGAVKLDTANKFAVTL